MQKIVSLVLLIFIQVTLVSWNEPYQKLASCDSTGIIFVWIKEQSQNLIYFLQTLKRMQRHNLKQQFVLRCGLFNSQRFNLNFYLSNEEKDILIFLFLNVLNFDNSLHCRQLKSASYYNIYREESDFKMIKFYLNFVPGHFRRTIPKFTFKVFMISNIIKGSSIAFPN